MRNIAPMLFGSLPKATKALIYICAGVFVLELFLKDYLIYYFGLIPLRVIDSFWIWQTVTYIFLHGGFWHFFFNILMLWIFGRIIESALGTKEFLFYFFMCGIGAGIISIIFSFGSPRPIIGASGAIYGLMVGFAILYPKQIVYLYFLLPVKAWQMVAMLVVMELAMSFSNASLNPFGVFSTTNAMSPTTSGEDSHRGLGITIGRDAAIASNSGIQIPPYTIGIAKISLDR